MLSTYEQTHCADQEIDFDGENPSQVSMIIGAKALKLWMKASGLKLSANAYETLNQFCIQLLTCLVSKSCRLYDNQDFEGQPPIYGPVNVSWSFVMRAVKEIVPSLEGWFTTWYSQLSDHVNCKHANNLPEQMPCCREMGDKCNIVAMDECEKLIRLSIPPTRTLNWFSIVTMSCTVNEVVHWILKIGAKVLQTKGLGTLRRSEITAIITKAPIFETLHPHLAALNERPVLVPSPKQKMNMPNALGLYNLPYQSHTVQIRPIGEDYEMHNPEVQFQSYQQELDNMAYETTAVSVEHLYKLYEEKLNQKPRNEDYLTDWNAPISYPCFDPSKKKSEDGDNVKTRYVVCADEKLPWMKIKENPAEELSFMTSTGIQTDEVLPLHPAKNKALDSDRIKMRSMQEEIDSLKNLLMKLLKN